MDANLCVWLLMCVSSTQSNLTTRTQILLQVSHTNILYSCTRFCPWTDSVVIHFCFILLPALSCRDPLQLDTGSSAGKTQGYISSLGWHKWSSDFQDLPNQRWRDKVCVGVLHDVGKYSDLHVHMGSVIVLYLKEIKPKILHTAFKAARCLTFLWRSFMKVKF